MRSSYSRGTRLVSSALVGAYMAAIAPPVYSQELKVERNLDVQQELTLRPAPTFDEPSQRNLRDISEVVGENSYSPTAYRATPSPERRGFLSRLFSQRKPSQLETAVSSDTNTNQTSKPPEERSENDPRNYWEIKIPWTIIGVAGAAAAGFFGWQWYEERQDRKEAERNRTTVTQPPPPSGGPIGGEPGGK